MDLSSIRDTVANLSLYDIKAGVRKVQNGEHVLFRMLLQQGLTTMPLMQP